VTFSVPVNDEGFLARDRVPLQRAVGETAPIELVDNLHNESRLTDPERADTRGQPVLLPRDDLARAGWHIGFDGETTASLHPPPENRHRGRQPELGPAAEQHGLLVRTETNGPLTPLQAGRAGRTDGLIARRSASQTRQAHLQSLTFVSQSIMSPQRALPLEIRR
jgi:hypothetical protein